LFCSDEVQDHSKYQGHTTCQGNGIHVNHIYRFHEHIFGEYATNTLS